MSLFKKLLIAIVANNQEDLCMIVDMLGDYTKAYRIGVFNDKKEVLVTLYISKLRLKRLMKIINDGGYNLIERSKNYIYEVKKS